MKVTKEIIKTLDISDADKRLLDSLLLDIVLCALINLVEYNKKI